MPELKYVLSQRIMSSAFTGAVIYAVQRKGKSSYALQVMYDIYHDWNRVLAHTFFKLDDIIAFLREAVKNDEIIPVILWDDASVYGSSQLYFTNPEKSRYLQALLDVIGSKVRGVLLTTPNPANLLKSVRSYEFYRVKITNANSGDGRIASGYANLMLPSGTRRIKKEFKDYYNVKLPDHVYSIYNKTRQSYLVDAIKNLDQHFIEAKLSGEHMTIQEQSDEVGDEPYL